MHIRRATIEDIPHILPLWRKLSDEHGEMEPMFKIVENAENKFAEYLKTILPKESYAVFVAENDSKVVGYVVVSVSSAPDVFVIRKRLYVQDMMVDASCRRAGIGRKLMQPVMAFAKEQQIEKMDLLVAVKNEEANIFWKAMGFEPALNYMTRYLA